MRTSILAVARHILERHGPTTAMKLQKLCYYAQAWSLVWNGSPLFEEEFQAWATGPVSPALYDVHRNEFTVLPKDVPGDHLSLTHDQTETIDAVIEAYGVLDAYQLGTLVHAEAPWFDARGGIPAGTRCTSVISLDAMAEYYGNLVDAEQESAQPARTDHPVW